MSHDAVTMRIFGEQEGFMSSKIISGDSRFDFAFRPCSLNLELSRQIHE